MLGLFSASCPAQVIPVFAGGLDFSNPVKKFFYDPLGSGRAFVQTVVSLTGFALVGGPARQDAPKAVTALKKLNVPYLVSLPLVFQTTEEWLASELGVHPVQVALQVDFWHFVPTMLIPPPPPLLRALNMYGIFVFGFLAPCPTCSPPPSNDYGFADISSQSAGICFHRGRTPLFLRLDCCS